MDIEYLLLLQNFRNAIHDGLTPFLEALSLFSVTYLVIVPALIYWCVDKRCGLYTLASYFAGVAFNAVVKLTACVYRPWIRDARVLPAGNAIETATGYSFPSGHTASATPLYGGLAVHAWKKLRWVSVLCLVLIGLTGFSRNYLGVHTPQDVIVALVIGGLALLGMAALFRWLDKHPARENWVLLAGVLAGALALVYITLKPYPMDYADGKLLVDPQRMMKDGYGDVGMLIAFCAGRWIEKTWIRFRPVCTKRSVAVGLVGAVIAFFLIQLLGDPMKALFGLHWGCFAENVLIVLFLVAGWPAVMKTCPSPESPERTDETEMA